MQISARVSDLILLAYNMKIILKAILSLSFLCLFSCATTEKMNQLSIGQTKTQVRSVLGEPKRTSVISGVESWHYLFPRSNYEAFNRLGQVGEKQVVVFRNGVVSEWGAANQIRSYSSISNSSRYLHGKPQN